MKREFPEDNAAMFSKLHHQPRTTKFHHLSSPPHHTAVAVAVAATEELDSHRNVAKEDSLALVQRPPTSDGATIEVIRRPRGRPPGSKNKTKPPVFIHRQPSEPAMSSYVLELPAGVNIIESTVDFCRKRNMGLCVLSGNGAVSNVALKQPSASPSSFVTFHGRFDILSISATIQPTGGLAAGNGPFGLTLAGPQGQVVGGHVVGPLISAGIIFLIAADFSNPSFHRLQQIDNDGDDSAGDGGLHDSPNTASDGGGSGGATSGGASMYSYQTSDVIWAPTTRQPPPPPPPPPPPY